MKNNSSGREKWFSGQEHLLLFQRIWLNSKHPHGVSESFVNLVPGNLTLFSGLYGYK